MDIVSTYVDKQQVEAALASMPMLNKFAHEFCHAFGTRVYCVEHRGIEVHAARIELSNGYHIGGLQYSGYDSRAKYRVDISSICSSRWVRNIRQSNSTVGVITAIKKKKEHPTNDNTLQGVTKAITYALNSVTSNTFRATLDVPNFMVIDMAKATLGLDNFTVQQHKPRLRELYHKYTETLKEGQAAYDIKKRFSRGVTAIILPAGQASSATPYAYFVADCVADDRNVAFQTPLKRYSSLRESEHAPTVAMIRQYMEGTSSFTTSNELGIIRADHYFADIDVAVGYADADMAVLLPKHAA